MAKSLNPMGFRPGKFVEARCPQIELGFVPAILEIWVGACVLVAFPKALLRAFPPMSNLVMVGADDIRPIAKAEKL